MRVGRVVVFLIFGLLLARFESAAPRCVRLSSRLALLGFAECESRQLLTEVVIVSRMVKVEMVVNLDLDRPLAAAQAATEVRAQVSGEQWEGLVLWASALLEQADPVMALRVAESVSHRIDLMRRGRR